VGEKNWISDLADHDDASVCCRFSSGGFRTENSGSAGTCGSGSESGTGDGCATDTGAASAHSRGFGGHAEREA